MESEKIDLTNQKKKLKTKNKGDPEKYKNMPRVQLQEESIVNRILNFYKLKETSSKISCHGRPTSKHIKQMKSVYGVNHVLTLQYEKEKPQEVEKWCINNEINWHHIELYAANMPYFQKKDTQKLIAKHVLDLYHLLKKEEITLFIHCAAGVHRTGTIVYSILRMFGESPEDALKAMEYIRLETRKNVGEERIAIAEQYIVPILLKAISQEENLKEEQMKEAQILNDLNIK
jgi:protein-tyrosine phosphatase